VTPKATAFFELRYNNSLQPGYMYTSHFPGKLRQDRRVKSPKQLEELFDYGEEMFRNGISNIGICVWNGNALERRHRYD
jgi:hypothetical protein